jgi:peptide/nickel transport system permease protein
MATADATQVGAAPTVRSRRPIVRLLALRIPLGILSVFLVSAIVYLATVILPGDAARAILGQSATPARLAALRHQLGLDHPALQSYWDWLTNFLSGHYGNSLASQVPVTTIVKPAILNSAVLVLVTSVVSTILGVVSGVTAAHRKDTVVDHVGSVLALVANAIPEFVVGVFTVIVFSVGVFQWFPAVSILPPGEHIWDQPEKLVLPTLTLVIVVTPYMFRMVRASVIEALRSDYAEVAELKGVSNTRLLYLHALPNAMPPAVQVFGLNLLYLAGGIVLVETVFQYPGVGLTLVNAISDRDVPVIQFLVVLLATFYVFLNIATDAVVLLLTPRRRVSR